jgi:chaperonin GroL
MGIKRGIDKTCAYLVEELEKNCKPVRGGDDIRAVASISAGNDDEIGLMISGAIEKVGPDGVLSIESGTGLETTVEIEEGMEIDRGYISPQFVTNSERLQVDYDNCRCLVTDHKIEKISDLIPLLEKISKANQPLLIIAEDVTAEALATLVVNKLRQVISVVAIKAPGFGERRKALLQDIAIVTGAEFVAKDLGMAVEAVELEQLGHIRKLTVRKDTTTLIADAGSADEIRARVQSLKKELAESTSTYDTEKLSERIAKLSGGVAVIKVGAATEAELEDRKLRIEDAKNATFAAVEEGVVPGGGSALVHLAAILASSAFKKSLKDEELLGCEIVQKSITAPARLIAHNAGVEGEVVVRKVMDNPTFAYGYNAMTDSYGDLLEQGVLDPKKVTRSGLQNACSVAGMVLTTQALISEAPKAPPPGAAGALKPGSVTPRGSTVPPGMMTM